jgi:hypothetical protein
MKYIILVSTILIAFDYMALPVIAGCISDCKSDYESKVEDCQLLSGDDPDETDTLKSCIDDAKDEYDSCEDECTS